MDYSHDDSIHEYVAIPYMISIHPNHGSTSGGTTILLEGTNFLFSETLSCSFGNKTSRAMHIDSHHIKCKSPPARSHDSFKINL